MEEETFTSVDEYRAARAIELYCFYGIPAQMVDDKKAMLFAMKRGDIVRPRSADEQLQIIREIAQQTTIAISANGVFVGYATGLEMSTGHDANVRGQINTTVTLPPIRMTHVFQ